MARLACLPCLEPSLVFWYDTQHGGVLWRAPTRGGAAVTCNEGDIRHACEWPSRHTEGLRTSPKGVVKERGR